MLPGKPLTVDSRTNLETTRALAHGKLSVPRSLVTRAGHGGNHYSLYGPLLPVVALPGFLAAGIFEEMSQPGDEGCRLGDRLALATNTWLSALLIWLLFRIGVMASIPAWESALLAGVCGLSTLIFPYSRDFFNQPLTAVCLLAAFYFLILQKNRQADSAGVERNNLQFVWASFAMGASILSRMDMMVLVPGFLLSASVLAWRTYPRGGINFWKSIAAVVIPISFCAGSLLLFDWYRWGGLLATPYARLSFRTPWIDTLPRFFFSPDLSVLLYNPLLLVSWGMIFLTWRTCRWLYSGVLVLSITYLILISSYVDYHGGICPGPRYLMVLVPLHLLPLFLGWKYLQRKWMAFAAISLVALPGLLMNGYSAWVDYTKMPTAWDFWSSLLSG